MRVVFRPDIIPNRSNTSRHKSIAAASGIRAASRRTGDVSRHIDGSNPLRSFTILNAALNIAGAGGIEGFLGRNSKVVLAGFGTSWEEILLPYKQLPVELSLGLSSLKLHRFAALFPQKYSFDGERLIVRGQISEEEKTMLLWLLDNDEERARLKIFCDGSHGKFLLGANLPLAGIYGIEYQGNHIREAALKLGSWIGKKGDFPKISGDRFYDGGESEGTYWYRSDYCLEQLDFDGQRVSGRIVLMQADAAELEGIEEQSIKLYFASGLLREEVFNGNTEPPRRILEEAVRILQPGGILFLDEGEAALVPLGLGGLLEKHFNFHPIGQNGELSKYIQSQLVLMGIINEKEPLSDTGFWQKKGAGEISLTLPDNAIAENLPAPARERKVENRDIWSYLEVMAVQDLIQANPVDGIELTGGERQILQRGIFTEPIVVEKETGRVLEGLGRLKFMHEYGYVGIPSLIFGDLAPGASFPFGAKNLFFPLERLRVPSNRPDNSDFSRIYLNFARAYLKELSEDARFSFQVAADDSNIYSLELN